MVPHILRIAQVLVLIPYGIVDGQSVEEMMAKMEAESDARAEEKMAAQLRVMMGEADGNEGEVPASSAFDKVREDPRRPKQIGVKTARAFMKEALAALSTEDALAALAAARKNVDLAQEDHWDALTRTLGPALERLTRDVVQKYPFAEDFEQAVASVGDAQQRKGDKELTEAMERLNEIFTGKVSLGKSSALKDLEAMAEKFMNQDKVEQERSIAASDEILEAAASNEVAAHVKEYREAMHAVYTMGPDYVQKTVAEMIGEAKSKMNSGKKAALEERERFDLRMGVLLNFLPPLERQKLLEPDDKAADSQIEL